MENPVEIEIDLGDWKEETEERIPPEPPIWDLIKAINWAVLNESEEGRVLVRTVEFLGWKVRDLERKIKELSNAS